MRGQEFVVQTERLSVQRVPEGDNRPVLLTSRLLWDWIDGNVISEYVFHISGRARRTDVCAPMKPAASLGSYIIKNVSQMYPPPSI